MAYQSPLSPVTVTLCPCRREARTSVLVLGPWRRLRLEEEEERRIVPWRVCVPSGSSLSSGSSSSVFVCRAEDST